MASFLLTPQFSIRAGETRALSITCSRKIIGHIRISEVVDKADQEPGITRLDPKTAKFIVGPGELKWL
ncbi:MAG: hypothetical protein R2850_01385 [Bacteroidia bacterium]